MTGKRCVVLARTANYQHPASQQQAEADAQAKSLRDLAAAQGMSVVGEIKLVGVGANDMDAHLDKIIARRIEQKDFDVLVVVSWDRITRSGPMHFCRLMEQFRQAGITMVAATDD